MTAEKPLHDCFQRATTQLQSEGSSTVSGDGRTTWNDLIN